MRRIATSIENDEQIKNLQDAINHITITEIPEYEWSCKKGLVRIHSNTYKETIELLNLGIKNRKDEIIKHVIEKTKLLKLKK